MDLKKEKLSYMFDIVILIGTYLKLKYFQEVFEKVVPGGRGTLSIKSDDSRDDDDQVLYS